MFRAVDEFLDRITMYRLLLYYLIGLLLVAIELSAFGVLHYNAFAIAAEAIYLVVACWTVNQIFARFLTLPVNSDSAYITALILALIIPPNFNGGGWSFMAAAAGLAMSKYLLTYKKQHIFNPAAIAVALTALGPQQSATWWVGSSVMAPFVVIGGILLVRRIRRGLMVTSFLITALAAVSVIAALHHVEISDILHRTISESALLFLTFVMLTEPLTSPTTRKYQIWYGILTGLFFPPQMHIGSFYSTPERALIVGNIFAFIVNPKARVMSALIRKEKITPDSVDFVLAPERKFTYEPGQYMEFTLPHGHIDARGQRRFFTLASSPTEENLRIGVKFYPKSSSFKRALLETDEHTPMIAANLGGDFVLPPDRSRKTVLIAGGIGVTPYRSMVKYLIDKNERRPLTLLYAAKTADDIAYTDVFEQARGRLGINPIYILSKPGEALPDARFRAGRVTSELIKTEVPDFQQCLFYISGPHAMVVNVEADLRTLGIPRRHIKTDFFSGYA